MKQIFFIMAIAIVFIVGGNVHADERAVPNVIAYQSSLYDDGGNPIADGQTDVVFRITDVNGQILYEEHQTLDVVRGQVSALVGNGLTQNGAPAGGIPPSIFDPTGAKYLEVQAGDFPPTPAMEIASVPYSSYAEVSLSAAEGSIESLAIADGSIAYDDLSAELVTRLASEITGGRGADQIIYREDLDNLYRAPAAAATIGIRPGLVYSGANDLQGAIQDIDRAVKRRDEKIDAEVEARTAAISVHAATTSGVHGITGAIVGTNTVQTLANKTLESPTIIGGNVTSNVTVNAGVTIDGVDISATAATLQTNIDNEASTRAAADLSLQANIDGKVSKSGDTMSGDIQMNDGACTSSIGHTCRVDGIDISEKISEIEGRLTAVEPSGSAPLLPRMHINSWGSVNCLLVSPTINGFNATVGPSGAGCHIAFGTAMPNADYAVVATPVNGTTVSISGKTEAGFDASVSGGARRFDFIVIGVSD